jgi:hypothetical protein
LVSVGPDPARVEMQLMSGELGCPYCGGGLAPWGHAAPRFVRETAESVRRIRPRRGICSRAGGCGRSHVLLPRFCPGRRLGSAHVEVVADQLFEKRPTGRRSVKHPGIGDLELAKRQLVDSYERSKTNSRGAGISPSRCKASGCTAWWLAIWPITPCPGTLMRWRLSAPR